MKTNAQSQFFAIGLGLLASLQLSPAAAVVNLSPAADTYISSLFPDNNAGGHPWFDAGTDGMNGVRRGLLRFNLTSIPPGSTIDSAVLQLTMTRVPGIVGVDSSFLLFRVLTNWNEGAQSGNNGAVAAAGEANWTSSMSGVTEWTTPGAASDATAAPSASTAVGGTAPANYNWSGTAMAADVQFWLDNPSENFGWLLRSSAEGSSRSVRSFGSREDAANVGSLQITYTPPTGGSNVPPLSIERSNGNVRVFWPLPATGFVLDETTGFVSQPAAIAWTEVGLPYQTNASHISITESVAVGSKFYRLRRP